MGKIIAILNGKGGVGKTTTAINLGMALWLLGRKVLLVDADPQCNLSITVDNTSFRAGVKTLHEWMHDEDASIDDAPIYERYKGLDYIPASLQMEELNSWLANQFGRETYLKERLDMIQENINYDYIIIDCAPAVKSLLNWNVLAAADGIIIPTRTDFYGVQSKSTLLQQVETVRRKMKKELPILGYLLTQFEPTKTAKQIKEFFSEEDNVNLFPTTIRKCVSCTAAQPYQMSLYEYAPESTAADDYFRLAEYLEGKTRTKSQCPAIWKEKAMNAYESFIELQNAQ